jgi:hypothetical protein
MSDFDSRLMTLRGVRDDRGALMFAEGGRDLPFEIRRIYALYDVPEGKMRGGHGHRHLEQLFVALSGAFEVVVGDGRALRTHRLSSPTEGLYVGRMMWREVVRFTPGAVCLVLASLPYDPDDYIPTYEALRREKGLL